jgi:hypothetical protein
MCATDHDHLAQDTISDDASSGDRQNFNPATDPLHDTKSLCCVDDALEADHAISPATVLQHR